MRRDEKRKTKKKREGILKFITLSFEVPIYDMNVHVYIHNNEDGEAEIGEGFDTDGSNTYGIGELKKKKKPSITLISPI